LTTERFGNFILKFSSRSTGTEVRVLFGATIQPPGMVLGYEAAVGGQNAGSLIQRKPAPFPKPNSAAVSSFPDSLMMPFFGKRQKCRWSNQLLLKEHLFRRPANGLSMRLRHWLTTLSSR